VGNLPYMLPYVSLGVYRTVCYTPVCLFWEKGKSGEAQRDLPSSLGDWHNEAHTTHPPWY